MPVSFSHFSRVVRINSDLVTVYQIISSWPFQFTQEQILSLYQESNFLEFISYHHCTLRFTSYHVVRCRKPPRVTRIHWGLSHFQKTPSTLNVWDMICYILIYIYIHVLDIYFLNLFGYFDTPLSQDFVFHGLKLCELILNAEIGVAGLPSWVFHKPS